MLDWLVTADDLIMSLCFEVPESWLKCRKALTALSLQCIPAKEASLTKFGSISSS